MFIASDVAVKEISVLQEDTNALSAIIITLEDGSRLLIQRAFMEMKGGISPAVRLFGEGKGLDHIDLKLRV